MSAGGRAAPAHPVVVVCERDTPLGEMLSRLGEGAAAALAEGRVFVGLQRAADLGHVVRRGEELIAYPPRAFDGEPARILFRCGGLIAASKPPEIATIADQRGRQGTLADQVARLTGVPGERLHACSRLDVGVSGVVLFAADDTTRAQMARAREDGAYLRHYVAVASGAPDPVRGTWAAPIGRDRDPRKRRVNGERAAPALTTYALAARTEHAALLAIEPRTGRTHQIRVLPAHAACALWGDATYGGPARLTSPSGAVQALSRVALHAAFVEVPYAGRIVRVEAPVPEGLLALWSALGGGASDWATACAPLVAPGSDPLR